MYFMDEVIVSVLLVLQLTFFSSLKKMRVINEKLMNEISNQPNDTNVSYRCWIFLYTYVFCFFCGDRLIRTQSMLVPLVA